MRRGLPAGLLLLLAVLLPVPARGEEPPPCRCPEENACYDFLNAPVRAPEDACPCPRCVDGNRHEGRRVPKGWNRDCWSTGRMACFLKRHAASWTIACSECVADVKCCSTPHPDRCPFCGEGATEDPVREKDRATLAAQVALEREVFKDPKVVVAFSPHFYLATDIGPVKVRIRDGLTRVTDGHEYAHLMLQRAEAAYEEFSRDVGRPSLLARVAVYLPRTGSTSARLRERYFRSRTTPMIYASYGDRTQSGIAGGFCFSGYCWSLQDGRGEDREMHQALRHYAAHILFTNWRGNIGENRTCPRWAFEGLAHWFGKRPPQLREAAVFCSGEARGAAFAAKDWEERLRKEAEGDGLAPIEPILQKDSLGMLDAGDHLQTWGWFRYAMEEWREPWTRLLADLRAEREVHAAFQDRLGVTPEQFQELFRQRVLGRRSRLSPGTGEPGEPGAAGTEPPPPAPAAAETGLEVLARIRRAGPPRTAAAVDALLDVLDRHDDDLSREAAGEGLRAAAGQEAEDAVWQRGLSRPSPMTRAYAARACRALRLGRAAPRLRELLADGHWLVRAEAAVSLGALGDGESADALRMLLADASPKVRIAAMDAFRGLRDRVGRETVALACANLDHGAWQVRVAACQCLAVVGTVDAVGPLIDRMEKEAGRVRIEIYAALKAITNDDLGADPDNWRKWWRKEEEAARARGGFGPAVDATDGGRYGATPAPTYYGIRLFSDRVGFVVDTSRSTHRQFTPSPAIRRRLLGTYADSVPILDIVQEEVSRTIRSLDPRVRFSLVSFGDTVRRWKDGLEPAGDANKANAEAWVRGTSPAGATNLHGALRTALALGSDDPWSAGFSESPDTLTLLTDGSPTAGGITDSALLLAWYTDLNRYARIRTHVVVFGQLEVEEEFLQALAGRNDGDYLQILEFHPK